MTLNSTRRTFLAGTGVAGSAALLAACSGQQSAEEQANQAASDNAAAADAQGELPGTDWERMEYDQVPDGGTLTIAIGQYPANWVNAHIDGNVIDTTTVRKPQGYDQHLVVAEDGAFEFNPDYITSAEVTSEDPQTITVSFNPEAKWENGDPIVVADLISAWNALRGENEEFNVTSTQGWEMIESITQTDDEFTAEIVYSEPYADWQIYTYPDYPAAVTESPASFNEGYVDTPPPSKGPFKTAATDQNGGVITLERNDQWWGRAPKLETITFRVVDQETQPQSFANSEIDAVDIATGDVLSMAEGRADAVIRRSKGTTWTHLTLNVNAGNGVLADVKVREAIARGIDREAIGRAVVGPLKAPVELQDNYVYMPGQEGYEDSFAELGSISFDPEAAGALLDEAGWTLEGDVRSKDGQELAFNIIVPAGTKSNSDRARQIMTNLNEIGFKVEMQEVPLDGYFDEYIIPKQYDAATFSWVGTPFAEQSAPNLFLPGSAQNFTNVEDEQLTELNTTIQTELDPEARRTAANDFSKAWAAHYAVVPFYATPEIKGMKETVVNFGPFQFESVDWTAVGINE